MKLVLIRRLRRINSLARTILKSISLQLIRTLSSSRKLQLNSFETIFHDYFPILSLFFSSSVLLRLGDFVGLEIPSEAVAICCFSALQTAGRFHGATKGKSQLGLAFQPAFT